VGFEEEEKSRKEVWIAGSKVRRKKVAAMGISI
jgi:hypothetical protein